MIRPAFRLTFPTMFALVAALWLIRLALDPENGPPSWTYILALPGMDMYRLVFPASTGYDGWMAALIVVTFATLYWSLVLVGLRSAAGYTARVWRASAARIDPTRRLSIGATLKLVALISALVSLIALEVAGPQFASPVWFDWFFFVLLPGDTANQLLPFAHFSGAAAIAFITAAAVCAWTAVILVIDGVVRVRNRWRDRPVVA